MTFARRFSEYAYTTVACGKLHHRGYDQMQGWRQRIGGDQHIDGNHFTGIVSSESEKYKKLRRHHMDWDNYCWSFAKEIRRAGIGKSPFEEWDDLAVSGALTKVNHYFLSPYYDKEFPDHPLFLYLGLLNPHFPFLAEERLFTYYLRRVVPYLDEELLKHPFLGGSPASTHGPVSVGLEGEVSKRDVQRATAAYYAQIETNEYQYRELLDGITHSGEDLDDWIIVYSSDHGEMLGEHGVWEKCRFYEGSVRVPLIIRWPKYLPQGKTIYENVNLCDLFSTLCDLARIPIPTGLDSRSLVPLMMGDNFGWTNESISQFTSFIHGKVDSDLGTYLMIKQDNLKYQYYGEKYPECLFDLKNDPAESENRADWEDYANIIRKFRDRADELGFSCHATEYENAGYEPKPYFRPITS